MAPKTLQIAEISSDLTLTTETEVVILHSKTSQNIPSLAGSIMIGPEEIRRLIFALWESAGLLGVPGSKDISTLLGLTPIVEEAADHVAE